MIVRRVSATGEAGRSYELWLISKQFPAPRSLGLVGKDEFTQREIPDRWAFPISTVMHWGYGSSAAVGYGILVGSLRKRSPLYGLPFGAAVWLSGYLILPEGGLYKPIWEYDAKTLADDLGAHLCYGAGTGAAFWLLASVL